MKTKLMPKMLAAIAALALAIAFTGLAFAGSEPAAEPAAVEEEATAQAAPTVDEDGNYNLIDREMVEEQMLAQMEERAVADREVRIQFVREHLTGVPRIHELECRITAYRSQAAVDAGGIVEWDPHWYCAHNYDAGSAFYAFEEGDLVHIEGMSVVIDGAWYGNYYYDTYNGVRSVLGYDNVLFQTCMPEGGGNIVIYYGHIIDEIVPYPAIAA